MRIDRDALIGWSISIGATTLALLFIVLMSKLAWCVVFASCEELVRGSSQCPCECEQVEEDEP